MKGYPNHVCILGRRWEVFWFTKRLLSELGEPGDGSMGLCHKYGRFIEMLTNRDPIEEAAVLYHEIGHAIASELDYQEPFTEEQAVHLSYCQMTVLANNPFLYRWIGKKIY